MQTKEFEQLVETIMEEQNAAGVAVAIVTPDGTIPYEHYFGYADVETGRRINRDTIFGLASVTKSFTAMSMMQLAEQGLLQVEDQVSDYEDLFTGKNQKDPVRIWHLLTHSAGYLPLPRVLLSDVIEQMGISREDTDPAYHQQLMEQGARMVIERLNQQTEFTGHPGEWMSYCNDGYAVLSDIIGKLGDCPTYAEYVTKHILKPLGMTRSSFSFYDPAKDENSSLLYVNENGTRRSSRNYLEDAFVLHGGGGLKSTISDMTRYLAMYLREGEGLQGNRVLSDYGIREMEKPRQFDGPEGWYGYGLGQKRVEEMHLIGHGGSLPGVSSQIYYSREAQAGVVVLCNTMSVSTGVMAEAAMRMYHQLPPLPEKQHYREESWSDSFLREISGEYVMGEGENFTLYLSEEGTLQMKFGGEPRRIHPVMPKLAITEGKYANGFVRILTDSQGKVYGARCGSRIYPKVK